MSGKINTYEVTFKGRLLAVDAIVDEHTLQMFSAREVQPHGYEVRDHKDKAGERARTAQTWSDNPESEGDHATAFSEWPSEKVQALALQVRRESQR